MATAAAAGSTPDQASVDAKITSDINAVKEKMDLCDSMLRPGDGSPAPSLKSNDALLGVIGFLEACAPRMVELVEAGSQGALSESVLMECLTVNDRLLKILSDVDTFAATETPAATTSASVPTSSVEDQFGDLLLDEPSPAPAPAPTSGGKTTGEVDPFGNNVLSPTAIGADAKPAPAEDGKLPAAPPSMPAAAPPAPPKDDFDDFLAQRTS